MMLEHVIAGQRWRPPSAAKENALIDAAEDFQRRRRLGVPGNAFLSQRAEIVLVRNDSSGDVARGGVLGLDGLVIEPSANFEDFAYRPAFSGVAPQIETHGGKFVIAREPIPQDAFGRAILSGETFAKVDLVDVDDVVCGVTDDSTAKLTSGLGLCRILAIPASASTGDNWCWVRLGDAVCKFVAKATSTISARSSSTPGSGTADLYYKNSSGTLVSFATGKTVYNWTATPLSSGDWILVETDAFGTPWVTNKDCS